MSLLLHKNISFLHGDVIYYICRETGKLKMIQRIERNIRFFFLVDNKEDKSIMRLSI